MNKKPLKTAILIVSVLFMFLGIIYLLFNIMPKQDNEYSKIGSNVESETYEIQSNEPSPDETVDDKNKSSNTSYAAVSNPKDLKADLSVIEDYDSKYFVKKLSRQNKYYFAELYKAVSEHKESVEFDIPINENELSVLMYILNYDCPELIHLSSDYFSEKTGDKAEYVDKVMFSYCMTEEQYAENIKELEIFFKKLTSDLKGMSEYDKEKYVYDYIFKNCSFDETDNLSGSAYGTLIAGIGRCEGYSKGFLWCMRKLGIECLCVSGLRYWESESFFSEHSWNIVKIDGNWYNVDIAVDNVQVGGQYDNPPNYGFFNVDDVCINESRKINDFYKKLGIPKCRASELNYHKMNNLFISSGNAEEKLKSILAKHFDDLGIDNLSVRFESYEDYNRILGNIEEFIREFLIGNSEDIFEYNTYYNELSKTIIINLKKKDISEGE